MKRLIQTLFFFLLTTKICFGQWNKLSPNIPGGIVKAVIVYGDTIVVGLHSFYSSEMGVYGSTDRGVSWQSLGLDDVPVWSLAKCGSNLLVGTWYSGIYRSSDWGANWENNVGGNIIYSIAVDGSNAYAGTNGGGVYVSTNQGNSWNQLGPTNTWVDGGLAITDQFVFAYQTSSIPFLIRKSKSSPGWTGISSPADTIHPYPVEIFAHGSSVFILTSNELYASYDYGSTWIKSDNGLPQGHQLEHLCSVEDKILCNVNGDIYSSKDNGVSWQILAKTPYNDHRTRLAADGTLLVMGTKGSGLYVSEDFGGSWNERGIIKGYITSLLSRGNILFLSSGTGGVYSSSDNGVNWLPRKTEMGSAWISELASSGSTIFAAARDGSSDGARDGIFRSFDEGQTWEPDSIYSYYSDVMMIRTIDNLAFMRVRYDYMMGSSFIIYLSTDRGNNWIEFDSLGSFSDFDADGSMIFGGSGVFASWGAPHGGRISPPWGVYISRDQGYTWERTTFPEQQVVSLAVRGNLVSVASTWTDTANISYNYFHLSNDNGANWAAINNGIAGKGMDLIWLGDDLVASTSDGIYLLKSGNNTWSSISEGLNDSIVGSLTIHNNELFLIGSSRSIWHRPLSEIIPVELISFTATVNGKEVVLKWSTATELNNQGFEIQRKHKDGDFTTVGFVKGQGTTTSPHQYSFVDKNLINGKYSYRLKQVDYDGTYEYSNIVEVDWKAFNSYMLEQNYPNPFNPTTTIGYGIEVKSNVKITILNTIGEEVAVVLNEEKEAGYHQVEFDASNLPSGVYFYQLRAGEFVQTRKMILLK